MNNADIIEGKKYWVRYGGSIYKAKCIRNYDNKLVFRGWLLGLEELHETNIIAPVKK